MSDFKLIEAANGSATKIVGMAYGGGKLNLGWGHPVVVDLSGLDIAETIPLLTDHDNKTECRVGMISAQVKADTLEITGEILSDSEAAKNIVAQAKAGAQWQLSIGADVKEEMLVETGTKVVNGQEHSAPFHHVTKSTLREVSVVAVGADASTTMKIAAKFNLQGDKEMSSEKNKEAVVQAAETEQTVKAAHVVPQEDFSTVAAGAVKAERKRISDIQDVCNGEFPEIEKEAISAGWDINATREKVLEAFRSKKPETTVNVIVKENKTDAKTLEAAFALRSGISAEIAAASYGEQTVDAAMKDMDISLKELMQECLRIEGQYVGRSFGNDEIKASFSSVSLPGILSNVANKKLLQSYEAQPVIATKLCSTGDLNDFKETERFRLTDVGDLLPVAADGEIKDGGLLEDTATNRLETYGKKFCLTRKMIINDDLNAFMKVPVAMGNRAARLIDQLFFSRLLQNPAQNDGKALFHNSHR
ncbi:MAG: HK97 family phage prohead protease, partial [Lentisphaeria bacterium]|nr:HK97 family phage prohead protease [Lentisphaeria bacterium]